MELKLYAFLARSYDYCYYVMATSQEEAIVFVLVEAHRNRPETSPTDWPLDASLSREKLLNDNEYLIEVLDRNVVISQERS